MPRTGRPARARRVEVSWQSDHPATTGNARCGRAVDGKVSRARLLLAATLSPRHRREARAVWAGIWPACGADPLHLAAVFGIDDTTAIPYATIARQLLDTPAEQHNPPPPGAH